MREELDKLLCEKYPKMLVNRHGNMQETCMYWGFACGDGWFNILDRLCSNIQGHIDWKNKSRERDIAYNEMATKTKSGSFDLFEQQYANIVDTNYKEQRLAEIVEDEFRKISDPVAQVTLDQVKEKFGTLRFYYTGGDEYISGLVSMAESMSGVTCETCGAPGKQRGGGWIVTLCDEHAQARELDKLLKEGNEQ